MTRPDATEYAPYYEKYVRHVSEADIRTVLSTQLEETLTFLRGVPERDSEVLHPPYTWTFKEVLGHLIDCERVFGYRALRIARGDATPLPGFDENAYAVAGEYNRCSFAEILSEFEALRQSHVWLFRHLPEAAWTRRGVANNSNITVRALAHILVGHERHHLAILRQRKESGVLPTSR